MGAEAYKKIFPQAIWPSSLPGTPPISFNMVGDVVGDTSGRKKNKVEFDFQSEVAIHAAGTFGENLSFFVEVGITPSTVTGTGAGEVDAEGWLMWQSLFPSLLGKNHLNIKAGKLGKLEISLPNIRFDNTFQADDYLYATELDLGSQPGFEINGFGKHWKYALGIVEKDSSNSEKDFYGMLSFKLCGIGYDGSGAASEEGGLKTSPAGYWRDDSVSFGFFGYRSYETDARDIARKFDRIGGDIRVSYKDFSVAAGYIRGMKEGTAFDPSIDEDIFTAEAHYFVFPWLVPYLRYEFVSGSGAPNLDKGRFVLGTTMLAVANVKLNLEGRVYYLNEPVKRNKDQGIDDDRVTLRLQWAF